VSGPAFVSVCLVESGPLHLDRTFVYAVPDGASLEVGSVVRVPFRSRPRTGVVVDLPRESGVADPKPVTRTVGPSIGAEGVALARWLAGRTCSTLGEALAAVLPPRVASEEDAPQPAPALETPPPDLRWLDAMAGGPALRAGLRGGGGMFLLSDDTADARPGWIVSMVAATVRAGRGVLVLLPEVTVAGGVARALDEAFGDALARVGSDRPARERYRDWLALHEGRKRIGVGGRAASLAPVRDLGLIVVDDESHPSYKEGRAPRFHARAVCAHRAERADAALVLVGEPGSVEAAVTVRANGTVVRRPRASVRADRPPVVIVERSPSERLVPAPRSLRLVKGALAGGGRVIVLSHRDVEPVAERTIRIASPRNPAVLRAGDGRAKLARAVGDADLIVATPFIAKDLRPEGVTLLALVDVDSALAQPEFRAPEDAFATWWRAGRWVHGGTVVAETADPEHPALRALVRWDPGVLWRSESERRRHAGYPPFTALARIDVKAGADRIAAEVAAAGLEVAGPATARDGWVVLARAKKRTALLDALAPLVSGWRAQGEDVRVDVDPWEVLVPKWRS